MYRSIMKWVLTVWQKKHLDDGWQDAIKAFDAVSIKIADGKRSDFRRSEALEVVKGAVSAGVDPHAWGYHYCRTEEDAKIEGRKAGKAAMSLGVSTYYLNLEKHWAGVWGSPKTPNPEGAAIAFIDAFKAATCGEIAVAWNGFAREKVWRGRRFCTREVLERCDLWVPMCYGSIHRRVDRATKWRDKGVDLVHGAMIASGRLNRKGKPTVRQEGVKGVDGFIERAAPDVVAVWYGSGAKGMLTKGNSANIPWPKYIEAQKRRERCEMDQG